jgi:hypothetical protein
VESLFVPIDNPAPGEIVRRQLYGNLVSRKDPNEILSHFSGNVSQDDMFAFQFDPEHRVGQRFQHCRDSFNCLFFGHAVVALSPPSQKAVSIEELPANFKHCFG